MHRKNIHNWTPYRELSCTFNLFTAFVSANWKSSAKVWYVNFSAAFDVYNAVYKPVRWNCRLHYALNSCNNYWAFTVCRLSKCRNSHLLIFRTCSLCISQHKLPWRKKHSTFPFCHLIYVITKLFSLCFTSCNGKGYFFGIFKGINKLYPMNMWKSGYRNRRNILL